MRAFNIALPALAIKQGDRGLPCYIVRHMKTTGVVLAGLFSILLVLIILKLMGYSFNKDYFSFDKQQCIASEDETRAGHSGIQECIFWMRNDYLEKTQSWKDEFAKDTDYCNEKYGGDTTKAASYAGFKSLSDPRCNYGPFTNQKRQENWAYLVSKEQDGFYAYCVEQICPDQRLFK